ncbi:hypothetical protein GOBAR_DD01426 [Gossypium barbadense]|nr:hypothetical protein GOBAR_DD01426 [Gossypium barbadense]
MVVEARYIAVKNFVYCEARLDFSKGLSVCYENSSFIAMINRIRKIVSIHVYVEHEVDTPDVIDDTMLLFSTKEREVNRGVKEPNCNKELNCNEGVNGRAEKPYTELGGESNMGLELVESSDACAESGESSESSETSDTNNSLGSEGVLEVGEGTEKGEKNGEISDPTARRTDYVDSLDFGPYGSDSDGEVVCKRSRNVCFNPNNPISHLELGMVFKGLEEFKTTLAKGTYSRAGRWALKDINGRRKENPRGDLQQAFWGACKSHIIADFEDHIQKIDRIKNSVKCTPPPAQIAPASLALVAPTPSTLFDLALSAHSQTVASEASASSPPTPSTQPTIPTMPTSSTQQILTRLSSKGKQVV